MLKRQLSGHSCEKSIYVTNHASSLEDNSMIYVFKNGNYDMFKVVDIDENTNNLICQKQGKFTCKFQETPQINWKSVGVFKAGPLSDEIVNVQYNSITGKVLNVKNYLIACPNNILNEK